MVRLKPNDGIDDYPRHIQHCQRNEAGDDSAGEIRRNRFGSRLPYHPKQWRDVVQRLKTLAPLGVGLGDAFAGLRIHNSKTPVLDDTINTALSSARSIPCTNRM